MWCHPASAQIEAGGVGYVLLTVSRGRFVSAQKLWRVLFQDSLYYIAMFACAGPKHFPIVLSNVGMMEMMLTTEGLLFCDLRTMEYFVGKKKVKHK